MAYYIDREELENKIYNLINPDFSDVMQMIYSQPSADVVEVVRCKDCKHNIAGNCAELERVIPTGQQGGVRNEWHTVNDDDFCKWGEKE